MASLFQTPWITMVSVVYHGILPWFTCFKTPWYTMAFTMVYCPIAQFHGPWTLGIVNLIVMLIFQMLSETMK